MSGMGMMDKNESSLSHESSLSLSDHLGPRTIPFVTSCLEASPVTFALLWSTGVAAVICTLFIARRHALEMGRKQPSMQRSYYMNVCWFAPILGTTAAISIFCPRVFLMMKMLQTQVEAFSLYSFGHVLFLLCAEESFQVAKGSAYEGQSIGTKMLWALNEQGPQPHFGVPPFGCCFRTCLPKHLLKPSHLMLARFFIRQYAFTVIAGSFLGMWFAMGMPLSMVVKISKWIEVLTKLSSFICIYGLFILYKATHHLLEKYQPTAKFVALKLVVILMVWQQFVVKHVVDHFQPASEHCLAVPGVQGPEQREMQDKFRERFDFMWLICLESMLVAHLVRKAFPAKEMHLRSSEMHAALLQLDLERLEGAEKSAYDSDSEASHEESDGQSIE